MQTKARKLHVPRVEDMSKLQTTGKTEISQLWAVEALRLLRQAQEEQRYQPRSMLEMPYPDYPDPGTGESTPAPVQETWDI